MQFKRRLIVGRQVSLLLMFLCMDPRGKDTSALYIKQNKIFFFRRNPGTLFTLSLFTECIHSGTILNELH